MNNLKFCIVFGSALHPQKEGGTKSAPRQREMGNMAQTFFYLKVDIKSKLFADANLSMTKKKIFTPIHHHHEVNDFLAENHDYG